MKLHIFGFQILFHFIKYYNELSHDSHMIISLDQNQNLTLLQLDGIWLREGQMETVYERTDQTKSSTLIMDQSLSVIMHVTNYITLN